MMPIQPRVTAPLSISSRAILRAMLLGTAKPTPAEVPVREAIAVLTPTSSPRRFTSGPPELPGLIAASVWIRSS